MSAFGQYIRFYAFALRLGLCNVARHGFSLGVYKTLGKVVQPINAVSRFPEYLAFFDVLRPTLASHVPLRLLDVGSPKPFGLYVAAHHDVRAVLSDINAANFVDYRQLSQCLPASSRARVVLQALDARSIPYADAAFDIIVSMSVIEHIEGPAGDRAAIAEMWRVLKPGGLLIVSVPFGSRHVVQQRRGFSYFGSEQARSSVSFFQRIYDHETLQAAIPEAMAAIPPRIAFVHRRSAALLHAYLRLGLNARALLGGVSPLLASLMTRTAAQFDCKAATIERYSSTSRIDDIYSDAILAWHKPA